MASRPEPIRAPKPKTQTINVSVVLSANDFARLGKITEQLFRKAPAELLNAEAQARVTMLLANHTIGW